MGKYNLAGKGLDLEERISSSGIGDVVGLVPGTPPLSTLPSESLERSLSRQGCVCARLAG